MKSKVLESRHPQILIDEKGVEDPCGTDILPRGGGEEKPGGVLVPAYGLRVQQRGTRSTKTCAWWRMCSADQWQSPELEAEALVKKVCRYHRWHPACALPVAARSGERGESLDRQRLGR